MDILPISCKKDVTLEAIKDYPGFQVVSPRLVAGRVHLEFAVDQARLAKERDETITKNFFVEIMVRASALKQISRALASFGIDKTKEVILVYEEKPTKFLEDFECQENPSLLDITPEKMDALKEYFGITEKELATVPMPPEEAIVEIIKERIALLNV